jgi:hypothetical protein
MDLVAMAIVEADVCVTTAAATPAPQLEQKRLFWGISEAHPGHFGISHQYAQKLVTGYAFPDSWSYTVGQD